MSEHKEIWLSPQCCDYTLDAPDGRTWCQDPVNDCEECGAQPVRYVLASDTPIQSAIDAAVPEGLALIGCSVRLRDDRPYWVAAVGIMPIEHQCSDLSRYGLGEAFDTIDAAIADAVAKIKPTS